MRKLYFLLVCLFMGTMVHAQTTIISPSGDGGFENGGDFAANGWTLVNGAVPNKWFLGIVPGGAGFTSNAAYVSDNATGTTWAYGNTLTSVVHFFRDVTVPAGETDITLSFNWQGLGESLSYDALMVSIAPVSYTPAASTTSLTTGGLAAPAITLGQFWGNNTYQTATLKLPSSAVANCSASGTIRLIFTWKNDGSGGINPPTAVDNISLISQAAVIGASGGTFSIDNTQPTSGTNFNSFTDAIGAVNAASGCGLTGGVTFNVVAGQLFTENVPPLTAAGTSSNPIIFQKAGAGANPTIRPTGTAGSVDFGFAISGGDYITLNGIDIVISTGSAVEYGYLIRNASVSDGANNNTILNSKITLSRANTSSYGLYQSVSTTQGGFTPTAATGANSNNKYYNLTIENVYGGIRLLGNASFPDMGCEVGVVGGGSTVIGGAAANDIGNGSTTVYGIYLSAQNSFKIFGTTIRNLSHTSTGSATGIYIDNTTTGSYGTGDVYNCQLYNLSRITSTSVTGNVYGIRADVQATTGNTIRVYNNFIYGLSFSNPTTATANISIRALAANVSGSGIVSFYHNSVIVNHASLGHGSAALYTLAGTININNNILVNSTPSQTGVAKHYAIYRSGGTISSNNNDLYVANTNGFVGYSTTDQATLANWQTATNADGASVSINPPFVSATDLHIANGTTTDLESRGANVGISFDIDGQTRPGPTNTNGGGTAQDIGADEFDGTPTVSPCTGPASQPTALTAGVITSTTIQSSFTAAASPASGYLVVRSIGALSANPVNGVSYSIGGTLGNGTVVQSSSSTTFTASGLTGNTLYTQTVFSYNSTGCTGGPIYNITGPLVGTGATCPVVPASITATAITTTSFTLNWSSSAGGGAAAVTYTIDIATDNAFTSLITGSPFTVSDPTVTLNVSGLTSATTYYYRIRANGACNSAFSTTGSVITTCVAETVPTQTQTFTTYVPVCWSEATGALAASTTLMGTTSAWSAVSGFANTGTNPAVKINLFSTLNDWLISRAVDLGAGSGLQVKYRIAVTSFAGTTAQTTLGTHRVNLVVSTDGGMTWSNANIIKTYTGAATYSNTGQVETVLLTGFTGVVKFAFVATTTSTTPDIDFHIDDFIVEQVPTCLAPTALVATPTSTTATIGWTASTSNPANGYQWEVRTSGAAGSGSTGLTASNSTMAGVTTDNVSGLTAGTLYTLYVRAACSGSDFSSWASVAFTTPIANDEASGATLLTVGNGCTGAAYTNAGATKSANEVYPSCSGTAQTPVWFKFVATSSAVRITTDLGTGNTFSDSKIGLFSATDVNDYSTFSIISCDDDGGSVLSSGFMSVVYATGLTPGATYYIAVDKYGSTTASGTFCVAVDNLAASMLATTNTCASAFQTPSANSNTTYTGWAPLLDGSSRLVALVRNPAGGSVASYTTAQNISATQRASNGVNYLNRNYLINNTSATNVNVQFFFLDTELASLTAADGSTLASLGATRQTGTTCQNNFVGANGSSTFLPQTDNGGVGGVSWIYITTPGFSNFYLQTNNGVILPAQLLTFSGARQGNANLLKWTIAQEQDVLAYRVERSENGTQWSSAGSVNSLGNTAVQRSYNFADNNIAGLKQYYRLRQVDRSGAEKLSNIVIISGTKPTVLTLTGLFPNPTAAKLNVLVDAPAKDNVTLVVMDAVGRVVKSQRASVDAGSNTLGLDVTGLSQGSYLLKVTCETGCQTVTSKFVKD